jgi:hypothetical protein
MALWRISYTGNMPGGDVFMHGMHLSTDDGVLISDVATRAQAAHTALLTTASGMQASFTTLTQWLGVVVEKINVADGSVIQTDVATVSRTGTQAGSATPGECAICVTFRTATVTRSGRGRWYLPCPAAITLTQQGRLLAANVTQIVTSMSAFFTAIQTGLAGADAVVYSQKTASVASIVSFDVGDVIDAQRRRRNKLVESRSGAAVT